MPTALVMAASSPKFLPCACDDERHTTGELRPCDFVFYGPQDIAKGERLAAEAGHPGAVLAYKNCCMERVHKSRV